MLKKIAVFGAIAAALAFVLGYTLWSLQPAYLDLTDADHVVLDNIPDIPVRIVQQLKPYQEAVPTVLHGWDRERGLLTSMQQAKGARLSWLGSPYQTDDVALLDHSYVDVYLNPQSRSDTLLLRSMEGDAFSYQSLSLETGETTSLNDDPAWYSPILWSNDGRSMAYSSDRRNGFAELYINQVGTTELFQPVLTDADWYAIAWSPDDNKLLVHGSPVLSRPVGILDLEARTLNAVHPALTPQMYETIQWASDGQGLYLTSNQSSQFMRLRYFDLQQRTMQILTQEIPWDVEEFAVSPAGDVVVFTANEGGIHRLYLLNTEDHTWQPVAEIPEGKVHQLTFHPDGKRLAMVVDNAESPGDIYVLNMTSLNLHRWTDQSSPLLNHDRVVLPKLIEYPTFDDVRGQQRMVPAYYYQPNQTERPAPVLVHIHGGPFYQFTPTFDPLIQYLVNELNIAVVAPNVRGSTGYGPGYQQMDNGVLRENAINDMEALLDWIAQQPELDTNRVAVGGGSYGGYMAMTMMARFDDRLIAGFNFAGMSDLPQLIRGASGDTLSIFREEYGDERIPVHVNFLKKLSPLYSAHQITKPLLVIQGQQDDIVDPIHSEQMVQAVRKHGGDVWYFQVENEGHRFLRKHNRELYNYVVSLFLETHLLNNS